jgi:hypothetical protein
MSRYREANIEQDGEHAHACGCWIWQGQTDRNHMPIIRTTKSCTTAARYYWTREHGGIPEGKVLSNDCGTRLCVRPSHHSPATMSEVRYRSGQSRLHPTVAKRAYRLAKLGASHRQIAEIFDVSPRTAGRIARGEYWALRDESESPGQPEAVSDLQR